MNWNRRHRRGRPPHPDVLTPAEWRVLEHVRQGLPNAEIAVRLGISIRTVKAHVTNILAKTDMPDRYALAQWEGEPAAPSRRSLGGGFALPLAAWTAGTAAAGTRVVAIAAASMLFVASLFAVYGVLIAGEDETWPGEERIVAEVPEPPVTRVIDVGHIDAFEVGSVETFALAANNSTAPGRSVARVGDGQRQIWQTDTQIRDLHDPPFGFFVVRLAPNEVVALVGHDPRTGCVLLRHSFEEGRGYPDALAPEGEGYLADPCHGAMYTIAGTPFFGPAPRNLHRYAVEVSGDGGVMVDLDDFIEGDIREDRIAGPRDPDATPTPATPTRVVPPTSGVTPAATQPPGP